MLSQALMPGSSHILVTSLLVFHYLGCMIFCMMFSFARQDGQDEIKNKQTITLSPKTTKNEVTKMG